MNQPLPSAYHDRYSLVLDGGSLEHVFHFPTALANCLRVTAPGGHFIAVTPANDQMGHGLYQFSPEIFFRVLTPANGFLVVEILLYEDSKTRYRVADPGQVRSRVELINWRPTQMIVWAKRPPRDWSSPRPRSRAIIRPSGGKPQERLSRRRICLPPRRRPSGGGTRRAGSAACTGWRGPTGSASIPGCGERGLGE